MTLACDCIDSAAQSEDWRYCSTERVSPHNTWSHCWCPNMHNVMFVYESYPASASNATSPLLPRHTYSRTVNSHTSLTADHKSQLVDQLFISRLRRHAGSQISELAQACMPSTRTRVQADQTCKIMKELIPLPNDRLKSYHLSPEIFFFNSSMSSMSSSRDSLNSK